MDAILDLNLDVPAISIFDLGHIRGCCISFEIHKCFYSILISNIMGHIFKWKGCGSIIPKFKGAIKEYGYKGVKTNNFIKFPINVQESGVMKMIDKQKKIRTGYIITYFTDYFCGIHCYGILLCYFESLEQQTLPWLLNECKNANLKST